MNLYVEIDNIIEDLNTSHYNKHGEKRYFSSKDALKVILRRDLSCDELRECLLYILEEDVL